MSDDHDDFAFEPIPGLPERLPQGEQMLWQGSPEWRALAISGFHVRKVAAYFGLLLAWQLGSAWRDGASFAEGALLSAWVIGLAASAILILCLLARLYARGTIYTLTSKRIIIRTGLALPVTLNLPLSLIEQVAVERRDNGSGSIALEVTKPNRIAWLVLWPNVRPWTLSNPQPLLRNLRNLDGVLRPLARALEFDAGGKRSLQSTQGQSTQNGQHVPSGATLAA